MKILMLAPEPFFEPRGTPISVYFRLKALSDLGHKVDLMTYHLGENVSLRNIKIIRIPNLFFIRAIKIGPSLAKIPLDFLLFLRAFFQLIKTRYTLIFSHEEAALLGVLLGKIWRLPHLYDMHSSLPQQLENFNFSRSRLLASVFLWMERFILKNSQAVIVICQDLERKVKKIGFENKAVLLENFIDFPSQEFSEDKIQQKRRELAPKGEKIVLYTGNFQSYQGIPLLLEAAERIQEKVIFLLVGGSKAEQEEMKKRAEVLRVQERVIFINRVSPSFVPLFVSLADVLVSPRLSGTNTPLKIYSSLKSGKPLVATNLWTHTQVLNNSNSTLVDPTPQGLADGILFALFDEEAKRRARRAKEMADREYTYPVYLEKIRQSLEIARAKFKTN